MKRAADQVKTSVWDVVVIGGGPAGMLAAARAAERGRSVLLLEKNEKLGKKLLISGGGRCNVTNNKPTVRTMLAQYKGNDKFLFSAFSQYAVVDTISYFESNGVPLKEENEGRLFPQSNTAVSIWNVLADDMKRHGVRVHLGSPVASVTKLPSGTFLITLRNKERISAEKCVLATGGTARPETGSTGDGFQWLSKLGHTVVPNNLALVPVALSDAWAKKLGGVSLAGIKLTLTVDGKKQLTQNGKLLFTHFGISGPAVLAMSKAIGECLDSGEVMLLLDLFPSEDVAVLRARLQDALSQDSNKKLKNVLSSLVPSALVRPLLEIVAIDGETPCHSVRSEERKKFVALLKAIPLHVQGLLGAEKAVVSAGGVELSEVHFKSMESRIVPGLFLVGDVLNIDRPSGGYSLQLCWTTGFVAGTHV